MSKSDHEYRVLFNLLTILQSESTPVEVLEKLFNFIFGTQHPPREPISFTITQWESVVIARAVGLASELTAKYVQLFQDPRNIPVTHYWKQKKVALFLDEQVSDLLWEAIKRSAVGNGFNVYEELDKDDFLDKPILFLKQEARDKKFPSVAKASGLKAIEDRFNYKMQTSGLNLPKLEQDDFHSL